MFSKTLVLIGLLSCNVTAKNLREKETVVGEVEHLDLEVIVEGGERQLFPLLPGTKCPVGHTCHTRVIGRTGPGGPLVSALKANIKTPLAETLDWEELGNNFNTVVSSNGYCSRRQAMSRAAGLMAGVSIASVSTPAYAAETKEVKMGTDGGGLQFVPAKTTLCKGDSVKWIINKAGPHNVVFDEDAIPSGVSQESISMDEQLGDEGETFVMKFDTPGEYAYYCEPHRGAGMNGALNVM